MLNAIGLRLGSFFYMKLPELNLTQQILSRKTDSSDQLYSRILVEVIESLRRQLADVPFLTKDCVSQEDSKLAFAPISNLGCESEIGWLDNRLKFSGGSTSVITLSNKNVITTNKYLMSDEFEGLTDEERKGAWKWARNSNESKEVKQLTKNF